MLRSMLAVRSMERAIVMGYIQLRRVTLVTFHTRIGYLTRGLGWLVPGVLVVSRKKSRHEKSEWDSVVQRPPLLVPLARSGRRSESMVVYPLVCPLM